jgi:hypothetical protein
VVDDRRVHRAEHAVGQHGRPRICKKWRPTGREEFFDISKSLSVWRF